MSAIVSASVMRQSAIRLSTISNAAATASVAASTSSTVTPGPCSGAPQQKSHLRFDARSAERGHRHLGAVGQHHAVEDVAEVGLVDPEEFLHRRGGEPDLVTAQHATLLNVADKVETLHRIGLGTSRSGYVAVSGANRDAAALGVVEQLSGVGELSRSSASRVLLTRKQFDRRFEDQSGM